MSIFPKRDPEPDACGEFSDKGLEGVDISKFNSVYSLVSHQLTPLIGEFTECRLFSYCITSHMAPKTKGGSGKWGKRPPKPIDPSKANTPKKRKATSSSTSSSKNSPKKIAKNKATSTSSRGLYIPKVGKGKATHHCWFCKASPTTKCFRDGHLYNCKIHGTVFSKVDGCRTCAADKRREEEKQVREERERKVEEQKVERGERHRRRSDVSDERRAEGN